jgi:endo-1,3(4)-beta-glucanase
VTSVLRAVAGLLVAATVLVACTAPPGTGADETVGATAAPGDQPDVSALPTQRLTASAPVRLADGLVPPTNRWYSGLVFGEAPTSVYPFPLAFGATASTFSIDLPAVDVTPTTIAASAGAGLVITTDATGFEVVRHDPVSVTLRYSDAQGPVGEVTIAEGWPVVGFTALRDTTLTAGAELAGTEEDDAWEARAGAVDYSVIAPGATVSGARLTLPGGSSAQWFTVPPDADVADWAEALADPVSAVESSYALEGSEALTRLRYAGTESTALVPFPGSAPDTVADCTLGTFTTAYGPAAACAATDLTWTTSRMQPAATFDLDGADDTTRAEIAAALESDLAETPPLPADTYGGGKALARLGALALLADEIGADELSTQATDRLWEELAPWVEARGCAEREARCFVYDDVLRTIVGVTPSFGSEEANDHHFHYGYFVSAASALARLRPDLIDEMRPVITLLAEDIAGATEGALAALRVFDPYRGHSWASGFSPFADGNNQESTSEAVAAWNAVALWAEAVDDDELAVRAEWMLSAEAASARSLWLEPDLTGIPGSAAFAHEMISLTWAGKRDHATWFSAEPSAILGIQLIPVAPIGLQYLGEDPERVARNVAAAGGSSAFDGPLGDYVLAYSALAGDEALAGAAAALETLPDASIDPGNARSLMLAWIAAVPR